MDWDLRERVRGRVPGWAEQLARQYSGTATSVNAANYQQQEHQPYQHYQQPAALVYQQQQYVPPVAQAPDPQEKEEEEEDEEEESSDEEYLRLRTVNELLEAEDEEDNDNSNARPKKKKADAPAAGEEASSRKKRKLPTAAVVEEENEETVAEEEEQPTYAQTKYTPTLNLRSKYKGGPSTFGNKENPRLSSYGLIDGRSNAQACFEQKVHLCKEFKEQHGHLRIPQYPTDPKSKYRRLHAFLMQNRRFYRKHLQGEKVPLTEERIALLDELGDWIQPQGEERWPEMLQQLTEFYNSHGHCCVSADKAFAKDNQSLVRFAQRQRFNFKAWIEKLEYEKKQTEGNDGEGGNATEGAPPTDGEDNNNQEGKEPVDPGSLPAATLETEPGPTNPFHQITARYPNARRCQGYTNKGKRCQVTAAHLRSEISKPLQQGLDYCAHHSSYPDARRCQGYTRLGERCSVTAAHQWLASSKPLEQGEDYCLHHYAKDAPKDVTGEADTNAEKEKPKGSRRKEYPSYAQAEIERKHKRRKSKKGKPSFEKIDHYYNQEKHDILKQFQCPYIESLDETKKCNIWNTKLFSSNWFIGLEAFKEHRRNNPDDLILAFQKAKQKWTPLQCWVKKQRQVYSRIQGKEQMEKDGPIKRFFTELMEEHNLLLDPKLIRKAEEEATRGERIARYKQEQEKKRQETPQYKLEQAQEKEAAAKEKWMQAKRILKEAEVAVKAAQTHWTEAKREVSKIQQTKDQNPTGKYVQVQPRGNGKPQGRAKIFKITERKVGNLPALLFYDLEFEETGQKELFVDGIFVSKNAEPPRRAPPPPTEPMKTRRKAKKQAEEEVADSHLVI